MKKFAALLFIMVLWNASDAYAAEFKPYTIMIYMNGSDLESESGMATDDIIEIIVNDSCLF